MSTKFLVLGLSVCVAFLVSRFVGTQSGLLTVPTLVEQDLVQHVKGKRFLIVGGTKGIGAALGTSLVKRGAHVVVSGRSKSEETPEGAEFIQNDVSSLANAQSLVRKDLHGQTFDTVVMTVGIITRSKLTRTAEGIEEDLAVSYMSRFVILNELIKARAIDGRKRVFIMGYPGQNMEPTNINDINFDTTPYKQLAAHMNTVLFNEALVYELAQKHTDLHVFGLNPGLIRTKIRDNVHGGDSSWMGMVVEKLIDWLNPSTTTYAEHGLINLMASPLLDSITAKSFSRDLVELPPGPWVADRINREKAWKATQELILKQVPDSIAY